MKKILSCVLCLTMALSMGTIAFAEDSMRISYMAEETFEIIIPEGLEVDFNGGMYNVEIEATNLNLAEGSAVGVYVDSKNNYRLVSTEDSSDTLWYTLGRDDCNFDMSDTDLIAMATEDSTLSFWIDFDIINQNPKIGVEYVDTITFTSEVVNYETFTIDGVEYKMTENMTWGEIIWSIFNTYDYYETGIGGILSDGPIIGVHYINENYTFFDDGKNLQTITLNGEVVGKEDEIIPGAAYESFIYEVSEEEYESWMNS